MIGREVQRARRMAVKFYSKAGIVLTSQEKRMMEVAEFGLGDLYHTGLQVVVYVNTERYCAKEIALFPRQTCPEHFHPNLDGEPVSRKLSDVAGAQSISTCPENQLLGLTALPLLAKSTIPSTMRCY